jgi:hypothetical protein
MQIREHSHRNASKRAENHRYSDQKDHLGGGKVQEFANRRSESLWHSKNATNVSASKEREGKRPASV